MPRATLDPAAPGGGIRAGEGAATATLLLPPRATFAGRELPLDVARALGQGDLVEGSAGERPQLQRHFEWLPRGWPAAALTRATDAGDAAGAQWLRADPAWIRPDINGARLFASGEALRLRREDADALLPALRPLFGDAGMPIDAPHPSRWYLRIASGVSLPEFPDPVEALGADLGDALVEARPAERRWRALLSEAQVVLHNHPWNAKRASEGKPPVNSLWFWGGGALPARVSAAAAEVRSDDALLQGAASLAGAGRAPLPARFGSATPGGTLFDLRGEPDAAGLVRDWLQPAVEAMRRDAIATAVLDFADGAVYRIARGQRWRIWRRPARLA